MISVALATYNEQANLARCLDSIQGWVDEIVVVDGSSTDATCEIAKDYRAKVIKTTNKPIFHINKQMAIDATTNQLIVQLDADEVVDDELKEFILKLDQQLTNNPKQVQHVGWWVKRKNNYLGHWFKKGGQYPDPVIRIFLKDKGWLPQKSVHEQIEIDGSIGWAEGHLLHYSNPRLKDHWRKLSTYTRLEALQLENQQTPVSLKLVFSHLLIKPIITFFQLFVRHKGFYDGIYGFIFAFLSGLRFPITFYKYLRLLKSSLTN